MTTGTLTDHTLTDHAPTCDTLSDDPLPDDTLTDDAVSAGAEQWPWVAAEPFRALLRHLMEASQLPMHQLAHKLGLSLPLCARLLADPRLTPASCPSTRPIQRIPPDVAEQLLRTDAVSLCAELDVTLSAHRARSAVRSLLADGHRLSTLHRVTGLPLSVLEALAAGTIRNCSGRADTALQSAKVWAETNPAGGTTTTRTLTAKTQTTSGTLPDHHARPGRPAGSHAGLAA